MTAAASDADLAADLAFHIADAVRCLGQGRGYDSGLAALFAGIAAVRLWQATGGEVTLPPELAAEPLAGRFAEGVSMALNHVERRRVAAGPDARFHVRPGGNRAVRALGEGDQ